MNKIVQRTVYTGVLLLTFLMCTAGIISSFMFGDNLQKMLNSVLNIRIYEPYIGGKVISTIFDPLHDDNGSGSAVYPANSFYAEGNLDLVLYTIHEPVYHAPWQAVPEYWQLDLEFRTGFQNIHKPDYNKTIYMYIDADNVHSGSVKTLFDHGENISFNENNPWDYALAVTGSEGFVYNAMAEKIDELEVVYSADGKKVIVRVPLTKKEMQKIYTAQITNHYVLVCAYSPLDYAEVLPLERRRSRTSGGGLTSSLMPKVYDMLYDGDHRTMLSSWNEETMEPAQIISTAVNMKYTEAAVLSVSKEAITKLQEQIQELQKEHNEIQKQRYDNLKSRETLSEEEQTELALTALGLGDKETAEATFTALLKRHSDNPTYLAYKGSLESMKGANASVVAAVEAVNKGYTYLDRAVSLTEGTIEKVKNGSASEEEVNARFNALLNRGGNSQSVPNSVFIKAAQGALDYLEAAEIARLTNNNILAAGCYYDAGVCFNLDDKNNDALVWKREASRLVKMTSDVSALPLEEQISLLTLKLKLIQEGLLD